LRDRDKLYSLHRLGITAHVFVDTWAHQGFAGVNHEVNHVQLIEGPDSRFGETFLEKLENFFGEKIQGVVPPLGHGPALSLPDMPYLNWSYTDGLGRRIERDNTTDFTTAADELYKIFKRWLSKNPDDEDVDGMPKDQLETIHHMLATIKDPTGEHRHAVWLESISKDAFGFGGVDLVYLAKGVNSWKHHALGTTEHIDGRTDVFDFKASFLQSHWKMFHDAAKAHRLAVVGDILPHYGICAA
jgi:hypothetical protein